MAAAYVAIVITALQNVVLTSTQNSDYRRNVRFTKQTIRRPYARLSAIGVTADSNELRYGKQKR